MSAWRTELDRIVTAATAYDGVPALNEDAELFLRSVVDPEPALILDGGGFALVRDGSLDLVVDPDVRGLGLGGTLLGRAIAAQPSARLVAWSHANHPAAARLAERNGFAAVRALVVMERPASEVEVSPTPDGVQVRTFAAGDEDALLDANARAFSDHPEQGGLDRAGLRARMDESWFDPTGLFLAFRGETLLGFHWTKVHPSGEGEVYVVGVTPEAQGLGLGRHLTARGLHHLRERTVVLYVEGDNTPALSLYASLGFTERRTEVQYARG